MRGLVWTVIIIVFKPIILKQILLTSTIEFYNTASIMVKTASILHKNKEAIFYNNVADSIKSAYNQKLFNPETGVYAKYTQASQLMSLYFDLTPENKRQLVLERLIRKSAAD